MKVLMISHSYYPEDPRVRREAMALVEQGYPVDIICLRDQGEPGRETVNGVQVYRLPVSRHRGGGFLVYLTEYLTFFFLSFWKTTTLFFQKRYKVIQVHTIPDFLVFCCLVPRLFGCFVILDMHEVMPEFFADRYNLSTYHPIIKILKLIERVSTCFASHIITVSNTLKEIFVARGVPMEKITIIMNVPSAKIFNTKTRKIKPRILDSQSVFTLAYHGLLSDIYDLSGTIKAIKELKSKVPGIKFLVIGSGPKENDYKKMVKELQLEKEVVFAGRIPQENIPAALSEVNLGVVPLKNADLTQLAFPTKLVEYVALGIPVLTADRKTIKKYFDDTALCFYDPADEKSLAECLAGLARDPEKRNNLVKNASKCYDAILWDKMKARYYDLIKVVSYK